MIAEMVGWRLPAVLIALTLAVLTPAWGTPEAHRRLVLMKEGGTLRLVRSIEIPGPLPRDRAETFRRNDILLTIRDGVGRPIFRTFVRDATILRAYSDDLARHDDIPLAGPFALSVRVPVLPEARTLELAFAFSDHDARERVDPPFARMEVLRGLP